MIPDPKAFASAQEWADASALHFEEVFNEMVQFDVNSSWRQWAYSLSAVIPDIGQEGPDPDRFETWQDWAIELMNTQKIWSK